MDVIDFGDAFRGLTGNDPFPWQRALYDHFAIGDFPASCNLPTGLGKTNVIAVWLVALLNKPMNVPRRLVYVVNRRTVVDQTTTEVENIRANLHNMATIPDPLRTLAISTLRGQFADNREWSADPSRPAVICGTVDMIGSRLLFSGYGVGFKGKPLHAGFLGQDVLLVHDEAHLEPAFQKLLIAIEKEQKRCGEFSTFRVMELSATSGQRGEKFELTPADKTNSIVIKRIEAKKAIFFHALKDERKLAEQIGDLALVHQDSGRAVLVFVRKVDDVEKIVARFRKEGNNVQQLTGTLLGFERDALAESDPIFARFLPKPKVTPKSGTVFFVCTSAGEVGVNISADHLICDLSTFESMAQRFGRVNRFGDRDDTRIDIIHPTEFDADNEYELRKERTLTLLGKLNSNGSPQALGELDPQERIDAFAPTPTILPVTDILFDAWALTTIREKLPGRPPVEPYLHGISEWEPPETHVAWREEVGVITGALREECDPKELLEEYPLKPHELLRDRSDRVFKHVVALAARRPADPVWLVDDDGNVEILTLEEIAAKDNKDRINYKTILLSPDAGGLENGLLNSDSVDADDVADQWFLDVDRREPRRIRLWEDDEEPVDFVKFRPIREIVIRDDENEDAEPTIWRWYVRPTSSDDDGSKTAKTPITWQHHTKDVVDGTTRLVEVLLKDQPSLHQALILAAQFHDLGKKREVWQRSIGHNLPPDPKPEEWLAKSGPGMKPLDSTTYRHEFGSLLDVLDQTEFANLKDHDLQELILHLIAVHHGYARPHFPPDQAIDPKPPKGRDVVSVAAEVPQRFARLQRKYGRWGLAYLESLLRAADWAASANPSSEKQSKEEQS